MDEQRDELASVLWGACIALGLLLVGAVVAILRP